MTTERSDREFAELLAAIWEHRGWQTEIEARGEEFVVAGDRDGTRGLILVFPGQSVTVDAEQVRALKTLRDRKGIDVPVAATEGQFSDEARDVADAAGLHLVDPRVLEETAAAEGFEDLLAGYTDSTGLADRLLGRLPAVGRPSLSLPSVGLSVPTPIGSGGRRLLGIGVLVVLLVGVLATVGFGTGALAGPVRPDLGFGGGGFSVTAVSLTQAGNASVVVRWDARPQDRLVGPNGTTFEPRNGTQFVVVQLNATNPTGETRVLRRSDFAFATGEGRYAPQYLRGAVGQLPLVLDPGESGRAYVVFAVPTGTETGTLLALPGPEATPIDFERNRSLTFQPGK